MVNHFKKHFNYDHHTNSAIISLMLTSNITEGKPVQLMSHLLAAQQTWLTRCMDVPSTGNSIWPDWSVQDLEEINNNNHIGWISYLETLQNNDLERILSYNDMRGNPHNDPLKDIIAHIVNHGTHHRAQIGQHLLFAGVESLPITDYIFYVRSL